MFINATKLNKYLNCLLHCTEDEFFYNACGKGPFDERNKPPVCKKLLVIGVKIMEVVNNRVAFAGCSIAWWKVDFDTSLRIEPNPVVPKYCRMQCLGQQYAMFNGSRCRGGFIRLTLRLICHNGDACQQKYKKCIGFHFFLNVQIDKRQNAEN